MFERLWNLPRELFWVMKNRLPYRLAGESPLLTPQIPIVFERLMPPQQQRFRALQRRYPRAADDNGLDPFSGLEWLYILDVCDQFMKIIPTAGRALDVGCADFGYLPALYRFYPAAWDGIELDAHQRYYNGHHRRSYGQAMAARYEGCRYLARDVMELQGRYDLITWFLPFVLPEAQAAYGLPARFFQPQRLLEHVLTLLEPQGVLLIVNQGAREADAQLGLLLDCAADFDELGPICSVFSPFSQPRYGGRITALHQGVCRETHRSCPS